VAQLRAVPGGNTEFNTDRMKKKHYAQRQKERIQELENDIEKILNGDFKTITIHQIRLAIKWDTEKTIWQGMTEYKGEGFSKLLTK
jgi:hypothetical protein